MTKVRTARGDARQRFANELRINRLLNRVTPPVSSPRLLAHSVHRRSLTFDAVQGEALGPKYPLALGSTEIDAICAIATRLRGYQPRRRWLRRLNLTRRFRLAHRSGFIAADQAAALDALARSHGALRFGHGDVTARNVLTDTDSLHLIDWEWAGLYPLGYDLAFLWFSLVDVDGGRARVEQHLDVDETSFLLSALAIQLWHLQWFVPAQFRDKHLVTRDELLARLGC